MLGVTVPVARVLGRKWAVRLMALLAERPHRPAELERALSPLSRKVLYERLQSLVSAGLVVRREVRPCYPRWVEFSLASPGLSLLVRRLQALSVPPEAVEGVLKCKWMPRLLAMLTEGPRCTLSLQRALPGITLKVLSERLRKLEEWGLVLRSPQGPRVFYQLTEPGRALLAFLESTQDALLNGGQD